MAGYNADDYVDVAQRIQDFYGQFPEGRLCCGSPPQLMVIDGRPFVWYHARAYRDPDDPLPGDGWAAEPVPGPTNFTRDSELMNAETAAWGRAIVALGFSTKKIASAQEVRARQADPEQHSVRVPETHTADTKPDDQPFRSPTGQARSEPQAKMIHALLPKLVKAGRFTDEAFLAAAHAEGATGDTVSAVIDTLTKGSASQLITKLKNLEANVDAVGDADEGIPFMPTMDGVL